VLDLDPCLSPETFRPQVVTVDGKPKAIRCSGNGITHSTLRGLHLRTPAADLNLPKFSPKQVKMLEKHKGTSVLKVSARSQVMCCKMAHNQRYRLTASLPPTNISCRVRSSTAHTKALWNSVLGILLTNITPVLQYNSCTSEW